jgi:hypothetical protein
MPRKRTSQYKLIDIGYTSQTKKARIEKIFKQIPKGKAMTLTDSDLSLPQNKILVKITDPRDIPPITRKRRRTLKYK